MFKSIKTRLFIWLIAFFALITAALGVFLYNRLDFIVIEMVDHLLSDKAELFKGLVHVEKGEVEFEISDVTAGDYSIKNSGHYFELADEKGDSLVRSKSLGNFSFIKSGRSPQKSGYFMEAGPAGEPVRLLAHPFHPTGNETLTLYVAEGITKELNLLRSFKIFLLTVFPVTIILSGLGSILIVWLSLRPLASFSHQIGRITEKRLHERVDSKGVDSELKELASSFNETMDRLEKAFQAQRDFLSDASHELRTPTSVIKSTVDVTLRRERPAEEYREALGTVKMASERMGGLIDRLLRLSRLDAEAILKKEKVNLRDVLDIALKSISPLAEERGIKVDMEKIEDMPVTGDREQLVELFLSILDNSIKYNRPNGSVTVSMTRSGEWAITRITDTGIGIAPEAIDKVFDRFYRADMSRGETPGTGLGLPIAKGIAESQGGRIEVESEVGKGSTFIVYLPVRD